MAELAGTHYTPSGRFGPAGVVLALVFGGLAAVILGAVYGYLDFYNPFLYINFLATIGFGMGVGVATALGISLGKVRNPGVATVLGLVAGCLAVLAGWVFWLNALTRSLEEPVWVVDPLALAGVIQTLSVEGVWSIRSLTPTGMFLYAIWGVEAAIIVGACALAARSAAQQPYCERCEEWLKQAGEPQVLGFAEQHGELRSALASGRVEALGSLGAPTGERFARYSLMSCANADHPSYLSLTNVQVATDSKGKQEEKTSEVIEHLQLSPTDVQRLRSLPTAPAGAPPVV